MEDQLKQDKVEQVVDIIRKKCKGVRCDSAECKYYGKFNCEQWVIAEKIVDLLIGDSVVLSPSEYENLKDYQKGNRRLRAKLRDLDKTYQESQICHLFWAEKILSELKPLFETFTHKETGENLSDYLFRQYGLLASGQGSEEPSEVDPGTESESTEVEVPEEDESCPSE